MNNFERFNEEKLPARKSSYSSIKDYLRKDVLLSVLVFAKFIATCLKFYGLDPCHYFSSRELSWGAMLKMTGVKLEKISDIHKYLFIEKGLRRGITYIAKRYTKANNK